MSIVYLDIETVPNLRMQRFVEPASPAAPGEAPGNYKNPDVIAAWVERENEKRQDAYATRVEQMALDIDFARVVAICVATDDEPPISSATAIEPENEAGILRTFWDTVKTVPGARFCGYNIGGFDLPILLRRSWVNRVQPSVRLDLSRWSKQIIDMMQILYHGGYGPGPRYRGLKSVCEMYGIPNPLPDLDGSMVKTMSPETLVAYCMNDVRMVRALANATRNYYWY